MRNLPEVGFSAFRETAWLYVAVVTIVGAGILFSLYAGARLPRPTTASRHIAVAQEGVHRADAIRSPSLTILVALAHNASTGLSRLILQLAIILSVSSAVGWAFMRLGQPPVLGEMAAGILLGPSLFGLVAPQAFLFVFAPASLDALRLFSQIGVCIFMFAVGMELDLSQLRDSAHRFLVIGHSSILIPYLFGVVLALFLYNNYAPSAASFTPFALVVGISMSITAFPVLVRILQDRKLFRSKLGQIATLCAAIADVTAWCILAFVVAIAGAANVTAAAPSLVSRMMKMPWRESLKLGALMNTRGLMELIVLNIGYDLGILSLPIFTMLVLMAIITTLMTGPLLGLFHDKAVVGLK